MTDTTASTAKPATPFPVAEGANPTSAGAQGDALSNAAQGAGDAESGASGSAPLVDSLIERAARSAHAAVDSVSERVSAMASGLRDRVDGAGDTRDEWIESARDAIRQHPFAAVAGAVLIGAALLSLRSPRER